MNRGRPACRYLIKYESKTKNRTIEFWTPVTSTILSREAEQCTVYEYGDLTYATDFREEF